MKFQIKSNKACILFNLFSGSRVSDLSVTVDAVSRPAARLHLVGVQPPELQLLLKQRPAYVCRIMKLPRSETL